MKFIFLPQTIAEALKERYESLASVELSTIYGCLSMEDRRIIDMESTRIGTVPALEKLGIVPCSNVDYINNDHYPHIPAMKLDVDITLDGYLILCENPESPSRTVSNLTAAILKRFGELKGVSEMMYSKLYKTFKDVAYF